MAKYRRVVVVGAGPAGAASALTLARIGRHEVLLLERNDRVVEKVCAGGLSPRALSLLDRMGLRSRLPADAVQIRGLRFVGPDGGEQLVVGGAMALVLRRHVFDGLLVDEAVRAGARLELGARVDRILRRGGAAAGVGCGTREIEADAVVLAGGAHCQLSFDPRPRRQIDGVIARYEGCEIRPGTMEMAFDRRIAPHYAWLFPEPGGTVNVGLCCDHDRTGESVRALYDELTERHFPTLRRATQVGRLRGHPIQCSRTARFLVGEGVLAVGEAGRLADCFTGEGIWHALRSGVEAARAIEAGDLARYGIRARLVFDPALAAADLLARFGASRGFEVATRTAGAPALKWVMGRVLAAQASLGSSR